MVMKFIRSFLILIFAFTSISYSHADKLAHLRTTKKIVTMASIDAPYFTIQIVALRLPPGEPEFFRDVDKVYEYVCNDGYVRYTVGRYSSFADAAKELPKYQGMGYTDVFVLNTRKISLDKNDYQPSSNEIGPLAGVNYTVQLAAYRFPVYVNEFEEFDNVTEYYMKDRIYRYCVGSFDGSVANQELLKIRKKGYPNAFLVPLEKYRPFKIE